MSTAIITLDTIVLNDAVDLSDVLVLDRMATYSRSANTDVRTQKVASGGYRVIRSKGKQAVWDVTATRVTVTDLEWLENHVGFTVCVRDDVGRKFYALLSDLDVTEVPRPRTGNASFTLSEVSWDEET